MCPVKRAPVKLAIVGAGSRGSRYAEYASEHPDKARVVAVAEPRESCRDRLAALHRIDPSRVHTDWRELASGERCADAVVIATQDAMHHEPAVAFLEQGYHMLLEKPMAPDEASCRQIVDAAASASGLFAVCHVMRYTTYTQKVKEVIDSGAIGDIVSIQHLEPVGYWHQAHSFVRGNWRNEAASSPMLLAKSCHDLDWLRYIVGDRCLKVASFGSLKHFRREEKPAGAGDRCLSCAIETTCPYSAKKIYVGRIRRGQTGWPVDVLTSDLTERGVTEALVSGPYGRCVYACDNDVVDHQVVNLWFDGGRSATFTMTAFTEAANRKTRVFGTRGELEGDGSTIRLFEFLSDRHTVIDTAAPDATILGGHGGGDYRLMKSFVDAVACEDSSKILSGPRETLESHLMVFAAEKARRESTVVDLLP